MEEVGVTIEPSLEVSEQIKLFKDFIEQNYHAELLEANRKGKQSLVIEFTKLLKFNTDLAEELIERPEEVLKAAEIAVKEFDLPKKVKKFNIRIKQMPDSLMININEIRSKHLKKLLWCSGIVRQKSNVRPHIATAKFECPSCGNVLTVLQLDQKYKEPTRCSCGRKGKFKELSKELVDGQGLVLEESPDDLDGAQPKRINVFLKDDLVTPITEKKSSPGTKVKIYGWVSEVPIELRSGGKSVKYDLILEANYIESMGDDPTNMKITEDELAQIQAIANHPNAHNYVANNLVPSIYGHDKIKESLVLQLVGGCVKKRPDGVRTRGDLHILLIGDPGAGKCVVGSTKVIKENGEIIRIKSLETDENDTNNFLSSINELGKHELSKQSRFWKRKSPNKLLKITTSTGNELIVTKDHPLFTTNDAFVFAKKSEEFKIGDYLALPRKIQPKTSLQKINLEEEQFKFKRTTANNKINYNIPQFLDKYFARFLGYIIGDGYLRLRNTAGVISFTNKNKDLLNDFEICITNCFNLKLSKRSKQGTPDCFEYYTSSIDIVRFLNKVDKNISKASAYQTIPKIIQKSPDDILKEFISALFDCEGHIRSNRREIELSSKSYELIEDLKYLLLRFEIISQITSMQKHATNTKDKIKRTYYRLRISGENVNKFAKDIGFISTEKQEKLREIILKNKKFNTNIDIVPNLSTILKVLREKYQLTQNSFNIPRSTYQHFERGRRNPSRKTLTKIVKKYLELKEKNNLDEPLIKLLNEASSSDLFWDKIKSIDIINSNEEYVYDIQIDRVHNFVANGIIAHNSQMLKRITRIAPKARFTSGKGASAAGLTASVVKDEFLGGWSLEAGTLVLANHGFAIIDELDKMTKEDRSALHEAMEQQTISVAKANIQATLRCETTLLAAANPKFGRFDPYDLIANQINLPPALINRFDLIFPIKDLPSKDNDDRVAGFILSLHKDPQNAQAEIDTDILKKYFLYIRRHANPELTDAALNEIKEFYVNMRNSGSEDDNGIKPIPINARQLEALVRLAEASAKVRMSKTVTKKDAQKAIELVDYYLNQVAKDAETGRIDIDRVSSKITTNERSKISIIKDIVNTIESQTGQRIIPIELIVKEAENKNIPEEETEKVLEKLRRSGDIFEPKRGFIQKL